MKSNVSKTTVMCNMNEQSIELSMRNGFKYAKMDDSDDDEVDIYHRFDSSDTKKSGYIRKRLKRVVLVTFSIIAFAFLVLVAIVLLLIFERSVDYRGHKVYKLLPQTVQHMNAIIQIEKNYQVQFWNEPHFKDPSEPVLIQISSPVDEALIREELTKMNINFTVSIEDLQRAIEEERDEHKKSQNETEFDFCRYHTYEEIINYLKTATECPFVQIDSIGQSFEGRKIPLIRITSDVSVRSKPIVLIDSLMHSKEWTTGATALFIVNQLISNQSMQYLIENFDFYLIPIFNPDGYAYSWRTDRLWRKTRSFSIESLFCRGADPNRNFDINFCNDSNEENSSPCSDRYCGDYPFSEPEVTAFRDFALKLNQSNRLTLYLSLHSFNQRIVYPYAYKPDLAPNVQQLHNVSNLAANAIKTHSNLIYKFGSASELTSKEFTKLTFSDENNETLISVLDLNSGSSIDWVFDTLKVKLSFALDSRRSAQFGYLLPKELIRPTAQEVLVAIEAILNSI